MTRIRTPSPVTLGVLSVFVALFLLHCGDSSDRSRPNVNVGVEPNSASIGSDGGSVESGDVSIAVPAGALSEDVEITVRASSAPAEPDGIEVVGPTIELGPSGTTFAVPATVQVPYVPDALPSGRTEDDVRIYTADQLSGPWTALVTTVDTTNDVATAEVDHLSHFAPGVFYVSSSDPVCPVWSRCDCDPVYAERPLDMLGTASVDRFIETMCYSGSEDTLTVLSYTLPEDFDPFENPDREYYLTELDGTDLTQLSDLPTDESTLDGGYCTPVEPGYESGTNEAGDISWFIQYIEERESDFGPQDWTHTLLRIGGTAFSFNRHLNEEAPYTDTNTLYDRYNGAASRFFDDGSARFYLHVYLGLHIDVMQIDNLSTILANPFDFEDEHGISEPSVIERVELAEGDHNFGYYYDPIHVSPAADDPNADIVLAFNRFGNPLRGFRIHADGSGGLVVDELPLLPIEEGEFWGQFGWANGGLDSRGILHLASTIGSFDNTKLIAVDPTTFELVGDWVIGCIGTPEGEGFMAIPGEAGLTLRFGHDIQDDTIQLTSFIRNGRVEAVGRTPFRFAFGKALRLLTGPEIGRLYVGDWQTGEIAGITVP